MINATQVKVGMIIIYQGELFRVTRVDHVTPGKGNAFIRAQLRNLRLGNQAEARFASQEKVEKADLEKREMEYLYNDGEHYYFMDTTNFEQIQMTPDMLGDGVNYLLPNHKITVDIYEGNAVGLELPKNVDLKIVDAEPAVKRSTSAGQTKNATLETGMVIRVPSFIEAGDVVKVDTETGEYLERV